MFTLEFQGCEGGDLVLLTDSDSMQISWSPKVHKIKLSWVLKNTITLVGEGGVLMYKHSPRLPRMGGGGGNQK